MTISDGLVKEWHMWAYINNKHIFTPVPDEKVTPEFKDIIKRINDHLHYLLSLDDLTALNMFVHDLNSLHVFAENIKTH
jgi:hypothetical protein